MWFFGDALFAYLHNRSTVKKLIDFFLIMVLFTWVASVYMVATNYESIKQALFPRVNVKELIMLDKSINDVLYKVMSDIGSDRASVARFHNTVADLQGKHFVYNSRSNEVVQPGVSQVAKLRQNVLLSMVNLWAQEFIHNRCAVATDIKITDMFYEYYRQGGVKSSIKCPILNTNQDLVGFLDVEFTTRTLSPAEMKQKENTIRDAASRIGAILSVRVN